MRRAVLFLVLCAVAASAAPAGAATGLPVLTLTPQRPTTADEITLSLDVSAMPLIGLPRYSWDLDGDGRCEYDTPESAVRIALSVGQRTVGGCVTHGGGTVLVARRVMVWPVEGAPSFSVRPARRTTRAAFARSGITLRVTWSRPMRATFAAAYDRARVAPRDTRALRATTEQTGLGSQLVRIPAPPPRAAKAGRIAITADMSADPVFGPFERQLFPGDRVSGVVVLPRR
jgi:hypothetical protein